MRTTFSIMLWIVGICCLQPVFAEMVVLEGLDSGTTTTGELLDNVGAEGITVEAAEIPGLLITAYSGGNDQELNTTSSSFGVNADVSGDDTDAFESGELMIVSFSSDVHITLLDFNLFDDESESFTVSVDGQDPLSIWYSDLSNKSSGFFAADLTVPAHTEIEFSTQSATPIGLDGIELEVIPEPAVCALISLAGIVGLIVRRFFR